MATSRRPADFIRLFHPRTLLLFEQHFDWRITGRWMLYSVVIGVFGALGAIAFSFLVSFVSDLTLINLAGYQMPMPGGEAPASTFDLGRALNPTNRWWLLVIPTLGGLISGWIVFTFAPEAEGHGTDAVIKAFHQHKGVINPRVPFVKIIASAVTIGSGGSAGREGPIAQIGASLASIFARRLKLSERERRILLVAGMAAGIGAIFRSPLGAAFFAVEVLYREDLESEALMPAAIASITGYSIYSNLAESATIFKTPAFRFVSPIELLPLVPFAILCAVVGMIYVTCFYATKERFFDPMPIPRAFKPAIGGLLVGGIAFFFPAILGSSYGWLQQAMQGNLPVVIMLAIVGAKIVATSLTIGSGGSGGVFAPSLVIGGMLGGLFGAGLSQIMPELVTQPEAYVMVGMATFFAGVANVPIATTIMISEMTGSYTLLVPLLFAGVIVYVTARRWSLYKEQLRTSNDSPAHKHELTPDLLTETRVGSVVEYPVYYHTLEPSNTIVEILDVFTRTREIVLPVAKPVPEGETPTYTGLVLLEDVQSLMQSSEAMQHLIIARDVEVPFASVTLDDTLDNVLSLFLEKQYPELPVVDAEKTIVGFIRQGQVISEYYRAYLRRKGEEEIAEA